MWFIRPCVIWTSSHKCFCSFTSLFSELPKLQFPEQVTFSPLDFCMFQVWSDSCLPPQGHIIALSPRCPIAHIGLECTLVFSRRAPCVFSTPGWMLFPSYDVYLCAPTWYTQGLCGKPEWGRVCMYSNASWKQFQKLEVLRNHSGKLTYSPLKMKQ